MKIILKKNALSRILLIIAAAMLFFCVCKAQNENDVNKYVRITIFNENPHLPGSRSESFEHYFFFISSDSAICYTYLTPYQKYDYVVFKEKELVAIKNLIDSILCGKINCIAEQNFVHGLFSEIKMESEDTVIYIQSPHNYSLLPVIQTLHKQYKVDNYSVMAPPLYSITQRKNVVKRVPFVVVTLNDKESAYIQEVIILYSGTEWGAAMMQTFLLSPNRTLLKEYHRTLTDQQVDCLLKDLSYPHSRKKSKVGFFETYVSKKVLFKPYVGKYEKCPLKKFHHECLSQ